MVSNNRVTVTAEKGNSREEFIERTLNKIGNIISDFLLS